MIKAIKNAQTRMPSVEPISRSKLGIGVGGGVGLGVISLVVAPELKAALKKASETPIIRRKILRACRDSFFINFVKV